MKEIGLTCHCGGTPMRRQTPDGGWQIRCRCGKKTEVHTRKGAATREWVARYSNPIPAKYDEEARTVRKAEGKAPMVQLALMLNLLLSATEKLAEGIREVRHVAMRLGGVSEEDAGEDAVGVVTVAMSQAAATELLKMVEKAKKKGGKR